MNYIFKLKLLTITSAQYKNQDIIVANYYTKKDTCVSWVILTQTNTTFTEWSIKPKDEPKMSPTPTIKRALARTQLFDNEEELQNFYYDNIQPNMVSLFPDDTISDLGDLE